MCGICGKVSMGSTGNITELLLRRMCQALIHRGPDDEGVYIRPKTEDQRPKINVGLGHRRLSIIDLSKAGHQPMCNEDKTVWIVHNGEIYNFPELKEGLEKRGHKFSSRTDTETILHLYEEKGTACLGELRGMFSFAIWDEKKGALFLARDRVGKKPLFYSYQNGDIVFASEIKALLEDGAISKDIDFASVDDFLNYQYIPAPFTVFKMVKKLPPAHFMVWQKGEIKIEKYWELNYDKERKLKLSEEEYCQRIIGLLRESTKIRLISDVPLGVFLSGGIDSSAVVAMAAGLSGRPVKTFSIGFEESSFDETPYAREISKRFGAEHREFMVRPEALTILPEIIRHFGEPYADSSAIPAYYLSKMTRQEVTVALNGDAGDESFGGYERYVANKIAQRYRLPLVIFRNLFGRGISRLSESTAKKDKANRLKRFLGIVSLNSKDAYAKIMANFCHKDRMELYSADMRGEVLKSMRTNIISEALRNSGTEDIVDSMTYADFMTYMPGDLLPKIDIMSMMHSLEARSPFLDHKFLEFSATIPSAYKIRGMGTKFILRKALKNILPPNILKREKMGFGVPIARWLKTDLKDYAREVLLSSAALKRGYFNGEAVKGVLKDHIDGKVNNGAKIWSLLNLELWHKQFMER